MPTTFTIAGVRFTGTGVYQGFTYDKLTDWEGVGEVDMKMKKRPNQPGAFSSDKTSPAEKTISVEGQFFGFDETSAELARELLVTIYEDGKPVPMVVTNSLRTTTRTVQIASISIPWTAHKEFGFTIDMKAADPKRYGTPEKVSNTLALPGSGLVLPTVDSPASGLDLDFGVDFGTTPNDGRLVITNVGGSETTTTFTVRNGGMPDGAEIVNLATGERLTYIGPILDGSFLEFDPRVQEVFVNGLNASGRFLPNPSWWVVPRGGRIDVQFLARGPVSGTPTLEASTPPAWY